VRLRFTWLDPGGQWHCYFLQNKVHAILIIALIIIILIIIIIIIIIIILII
jgi:hypothetical protein